MASRRPGRRRSVLAALLLAGSSRLWAADLPPIPLESYPEVSRRAIAEALTAARARPSDHAALMRLGHVLHAWEQFDTAGRVYEEACVVERTFDCLYLGGVVEARRAGHARAARLLTEAVRQSPDSLPARLALADALFESGDAAAADEQYARLTSGDSAPHARYGLGRVRAARGAHEEAVAEFESAIRLYPEFGAAWYGEAMSLRALGRVDDARRALARAKEYGPRWPSPPDPLLTQVRALRDDAPARAARALSLMQRGESDEAIREYEGAVAADPRLPAPHVNLIMLYGQRKDWARAEAHYRALSAFDASVAEAHYNYGLCLANQGDRAGAVTLFRKAIEVSPHYAAPWRSLGQLAEQAGRIEEAESSYRQAVERAPNDALVRFDLARMLIARRRPAEAIAELEPLAGVDHPDRARFLFGLATAKVQAGDIATGRRYAIEARDLARARGQLDLAASIERELARLP